jgi:ketosteroid isomerase-like protein
MVAGIRAALGSFLSLVLLMGTGAALAQEATPAAGQSIMQAYGDAWSSGDAAEVGRPAIEKLAEALFASDDDVRLEVTDGFVGDNWAVVEWAFSGVHPATGREVTFRGASVLELKDGLISEERDYYDLPDMLAQIDGAAATPAP